MTPITDENKELLRRAIHAWNEQDLDAFAAYHADDVVFHGGNEEIHGLDKVMTHQWGFFDSFSDSTIAIEDMIAEDDRVTLRYTTRGTHDGVFEGVEPTGETIEMAQMAMVRVADEVIAEKWVQADVIGLVQQLDGGLPNES